MRLWVAGCARRDTARQRCLYRLVDGHLATDIPLAAFWPYRVPDNGAAADCADAPDVAAIAAGGGRSVFGWIAGGTRQVTCRDGLGACEVDVAEIGRFSVDLVKGQIHCLLRAPTATAQQLEEVLLGPPLLLALASRGRWCLHASAIEVAGRAILLLGDSGRGKSTLAAFCDALPNVKRIADDMLPCAIVDGTPCAQPHFPQLKLSVAEQYPLSAAAALPIDRLIVLDSRQNGPSGVLLERLAPIAAVKHLTEQTVASGLFDPSLRQRHLCFIARLLALVPAYQLRYPHDLALLPEVCAAATTNFAG